MSVNAGVMTELRNDHDHYLKSWIAFLKTYNLAMNTTTGHTQKAAD